VNNVETLCCTTRIMLEGGEWFAKMGTAQSKGTKLLSVSGDCDNPGVYEVEFGTTISTLLELVGGRTAKAVQVGGPSGTCIGKKDFGRRICFDDLATGGSIIIIGPNRDLLEIVHNFMDFFVEESCGWCVPCRAGNVILKQKLEKIISGKASAKDIQELEEWCRIVKATSRCGLGQTSPNPIYTTIQNFREIYEAKVKKDTDYVSTFDLLAAVEESCKTAGRIPKVEEH
ncbi:MAG TPA: NADH-ubiquinone oxidoreductase-F iron-sulfur binding region domain-containing protein, partial [Spirochaetota bacterium]|nr:NADH-ubiquinone oxidoreductase-F iron-sulfur binding region domain-containing protein [Spirochaetota bacterium]